MSNSVWPHGWQPTRLLCSLLLSHFSHVRLCLTPWMAAHQAPLSLGFSRQKYWSGLPFPSPLLLFIWCHNFIVIKLSLRWTIRCPPPTSFPYQGASSSYSDCPKVFEFVTNSCNSREAFCGTSQKEEVTLTKANTPIMHSCSVVSDSLWTYEL